MTTDYYLFLQGGDAATRRPILQAAIARGARWSGDGGAGGGGDFDAFVAIEADDPRQIAGITRRIVADGVVVPVARVQVRDPVPCGVKRTSRPPGAMGVALVETEPRVAGRVYRELCDRGLAVVAGLGKGPKVLAEVHADDPNGIRDALRRLRQVRGVQAVRGMVLEEVASLPPR
jgi:hypothetical protein